MRIPSGQYYKSSFYKGEENMYPCDVYAIDVEYVWKVVMKRTTDSAIKKTVSKIMPYTSPKDVLNFYHEYGLREPMYSPQSPYEGRFVLKRNKVFFMSEIMMTAWDIINTLLTSEELFMQNNIQ